MADMHWFRWHHGDATNSAFPLVARHAGASVAEVLAVWVCLLEKASAAEVRGDLGAVDVEVIDFHFGLQEGTTTKILAALKRRGLLADGRVASWEQRQPKRERPDDNSTQRTRAFRQKQRQTETAEERETPGNGRERQEAPGNAQIDRERYREIDTHCASAREKLSTAATGSDGEVCVSGDDPTANTLAAIAAGMRAEGVADAAPSAQMRALVDKGAEPAQFNAAARMAVSAGKGCTYALGVVRNQLREATAIQAGPALSAKPWDHDRRSVEAKGAELGLGRWDEPAFHTGRGEPFAVYERRVRERVEQAGQPA